jgi:hypothetical protein
MMRWSISTVRQGDIFRVIKNKSGHRFVFNEIVILLSFDGDGDFICRSLGSSGTDDAYWFMFKEEITPVLLQGVTRASC